MRFDHLIENDHKAEALNFILEESLKIGFGSLGKTDLEVILFLAILKYGPTETLNDYALFKSLQITSRKVQSLKEKASLKYTKITREEAIEYFLAKLSKARLSDRFVEIPIGDAAVKNELEALLDENDILSHTQLNTKIFKLRLDDLFLMISVLSMDEHVDPNQLEKEINKDLKNKSKAIEKLLGKVEVSSQHSILNVLKRLIQIKGMTAVKEYFPVLAQSSVYALRFIENWPLS